MCRNLAIIYCGVNIIFFMNNNAQYWMCVLALDDK